MSTIELPEEHRTRSQELVGRAEVRGRAAVVTWQDGVVQGDPELAARLSRLDGGSSPATAARFLECLRAAGGSLISIADEAI